MVSSYLILDPNMTFIFNLYKVVTPVMEYIVSTMKETVASFPMIEGKLQEDQINVI